MELGIRKSYWNQIKGHGLRYWARVLILGLIGLYIGNSISEVYFPPLRYVSNIAYQGVSRIKEYIYPSSIGDIVILEITDEEYWKGYLAGRRPLKRDYLASLIKAVCEAHPKLVALDFDLRSPVPDRTLINHLDYKSETETLADTIKESSKENCKIVLPKTFECHDGKCIEEPSVLDGYDFDKSRVSSGYINLHQDIRRVPISQKYINGVEIVSFSFAIAAADNKHSVSALSGRGDYPYGIFRSPKFFKDNGAVIKANDVFESNKNVLKSLVEHKTVIFGGNWRRYAYERGPMVDGHNSPIGVIPGVYIHANYVASMLNGQTIRSVPYLGTIIEVLLIAFIAVLFAIDVKFYQRVALIAGGSVIIIFVAYFFWMNLGIFIEPVVPIIILIAHWLFDENHTLRETVHKLSTEAATLKNPPKTMEADQLNIVKEENK